VYWTIDCHLDLTKGSEPVLLVQLSEREGDQIDSLRLARNVSSLAALRTVSHLHGREGLAIFLGQCGGSVGVLGVFGAEDVHRRRW
jgi:hypothetical protein